MYAKRQNGREMAVRQRDRHQCQNCLQQAASVNELVVHQIVPAENGGTDRLSNLILLCGECHDAAHLGTDTPEARCG